MTDERPCRIFSDDLVHVMVKDHQLACRAWWWPTRFVAREYDDDEVPTCLSCIVAAFIGPSAP